jgi:hypothetical protein
VLRRELYTSVSLVVAFMHLTLFRQSVAENVTLLAAFSLDCCNRELRRYVAMTICITVEKVRDLLLKSLEYCFGQSKRVPQPLEWLTDNGMAETFMRDSNGTILT